MSGDLAFKAGQQGISRASSSNTTWLSRWNGEMSVWDTLHSSNRWPGTSESEQRWGRLRKTRFRIPLWIGYIERTKPYEGVPLVAPARRKAIQPHGTAKDVSRYTGCRGYQYRWQPKSNEEYWVLRVFLKNELTNGWRRKADPRERVCNVSCSLLNTVLEREKYRQ